MIPLEALHRLAFCPFSLSCAIGGKAPPRAAAAILRREAGPGDPPPPGCCHPGRRPAEEAQQRRRHDPPRQGCPAEEAQQQRRGHPAGKLASMIPTAAGMLSPWPPWFHASPIRAEGPSILMLSTKPIEDTPPYDPPSPVPGASLQAAPPGKALRRSRSF